MKIGIGIPNQVRNVDARLIPQWAAQAEQAGFSTLGTVGRLAYPGIMDTVALASAAGATKTIGLLSTILLGPVWPDVLLAKETSDIDSVSGGRLTLGLGVGQRPDDFVVEGLGTAGRGARLDKSLETFRSVWGGEPVGGGANPGVPAGARQVPMMFGGFSERALARMATWGEGYIAASVPPAMAGQGFDAARSAWRTAGRAGAPRLVAICYFAFGDGDAGRANIADYYAGTGEFTDMVVNNVRVGADSVREAVKEFEAIGADELILNPTVGDLDEIAKLAETVL
jgi:alkanesulfonate monooxygenase SsuD/methylene tetrahydromethanopterin reductase-like flavin-dependent oxidoreductase (luciferase family)